MTERVPIDLLRFPIGRFSALAPSDQPARTRWIDDIAAFPSAIAGVVSGLDRRQLETPYRDGGWTLAQVVHHLADSHMHAYIRSRFALAVAGFTVQPYDENRWATFPDAADADISPSLEILRGLHARWARLLRSLSADDFTRELRHPERGPMTIDGVVQLYAWHGRHHAAHISATRTRHGW